MAASTVDRLPPRVSVSVGAEAVSVDAIGESCRRWSTCTDLCSPTALSTVDRLLPRVSVSVDMLVVAVNGIRESCTRQSTGTDLCSPTTVSTVDRLLPCVSVSVEEAAEAVQHVDGSLLTDGSVDGESAAATCADVGGRVGGVRRRHMSTVDRLPPRVSVWVDVWVVSVDGSG